MTIHQKTPTPRPAPQAAPAWGVLARLPLRWTAAALMGLAATLAALLAWGLTAWLGHQPWLAPLAAALAVTATAFPAAALLHRLSRGSASGPLRAGAVQSGTLKPQFLELAGREWSRARRYGTGAALLLVDVDRFARMVEARGSAATDAVLTAMLRQALPTLRGADLLTRFSDAQMAIFLAQADATGALDVAERIRERTEQMEVPMHHESSPRHLRVTVSVGVAQLRPAHLNLQALIDEAQDAVLSARQAGGNCVRASPVDLGRLRTDTWRGGRRARPH